MNERTGRGMYYVEGSAARKYEYAPAYDRPARRNPSEERVRRPLTTEERQRRARARAKADRALAFNLKYTLFVVASVSIMVTACVYMLFMESKINEQQSNINHLESELEQIQNNNVAYENSLKNMYTMDQVYDVASNELGMVYAKKGQIVYYESSSEDYVKQYQDVPEAN